jgi:hypothetical protein
MPTINCESTTEVPPPIKLSNKLKLLNKETVTFVLLRNTHLHSATVATLVDMIWNSDELLENIQLE